MYLSVLDVYEVTFYIMGGGTKELFPTLWNLDMTDSKNMSCRI